MSHTDLNDHSSLANKNVLPWTRFAPILAIHFLGTLGFSLAIPFLVFIVADLGGASWTYGLLGATYSGFQLMGAPLLGRWSDRTGRRPVLVASQVGTLIAWLLFFGALSMPVTTLGGLAGATITLPLVIIFLARALDGGTGGNISVANAYVADLTKDTPAIRQQAFGRMGMAASLGFVIGPAVAGILGSTAWGPRLPVLIAAIFAAVTTIVIIYFLDEPKRRCPEGPPGPGVVEAGLNQQAKPCNTAPAQGALRRVIRQGPIALLLVATFILFLGFNVFYASFPIHATEMYGWSAGELGLFFAIMSGFMVVAQGPLLTVASKYLGHSALFAVGMGFLALAFVCFQVEDDVIAYVGAAFFALGNGLSWPTFQAHVAQVAGENQGTVQGAVTSASSLASIVGLTIGGLVYPLLSGTTFLVSSGIFVLVLLLTPLWFLQPAGGRLSGGGA